MKPTPRSKIERYPTEPESTTSSYPRSPPASSYPFAAEEHPHVLEWLALLESGSPSAKVSEADAEKDGDESRLMEPDPPLNKSKHMEGGCCCLPTFA